MMAAAVSALDATMPEPARRVCQRLSDAGHQAVAVGGAVRDAVLGRVPGDWDVATSATPDQVQALFARTIPTGLEHGTVTVLLGKGADRLPVEVTTFRGEGAYSDGRRPDSVTFGVPLTDDLARRDFVINAMAYDPVTRTLIDPFGGCTDVAERRIRAVGVAAERFAEDGLRVMRGVRFAAVLGFALEAETEAAIPGSLPVLARVSYERIRVELLKMLGAARPSVGLGIARRTGILDQILPEIARSVVPGDSWQRVLTRVDAVGLGDTDGGDPASGPAPDESPIRLVRLAALLVEVAGALPPAKKPDHPLRRLKMSNQDIARVDRLLRAGLLNASEPALPNLPSDPELRALLGALGRDNAEDLLSLWGADARARPHLHDWISSTIGRVRTILTRGDALAIGDLAISGSDLIAELDIPRGRIIGELLQALLAAVMARPEINTTEQLTEVARAWYADRGNRG